MCVVVAVNPLSHALRRCLPLLLLTPVAALAATPLTVQPGIDESGAAPQPQQLDVLVISATRSARALHDVPVSVDVIEREQLDTQLIRDMRQLVRYEPGVSVTSGYGRFGLGGFRIRGLDGNRVLMQTDGIKVADAFAIGSFSSANRNFVGMDTLKRVEIMRGPASAVYGSDALGGVVSFTTRDAEDFLQPGQNHHIGVKLGYDGSWDGLFAGASAAFVGERVNGLLVLGHRQGQATRNMGRDQGDGALRTAPNPQQRDGRSVLAKFGFTPSPEQRWTLTLERNEDASRTDVRSARGYAAMTRFSTTDQQADDRQQRSRVSLAHTWQLDGDGVLDSLHWQVYQQRSSTSQRTWEYRHNLTVQQRRERLFTFDQSIDGLQLGMAKTLQWGDSRHRLSWGVDARRSKTAQQRDGSQTNLATGVQSNVVYPDTFPVRDFPLSQVDEVGLYVQDEIELAQGRLSIIPGLRLDHYHLRPRIDHIFAEDNPGMAVASLQHTQASPKLGAVWHLGAGFSVYGNYAQGFRAPPYNDVNLGFTNVQGGYTAIPNPDLKPETSRGVELGLRVNTQRGWGSVAVYDNRYRDFIDSQVFIGRNADGLMVFQSRNVRDARIRGAEAKFGLRLGAGGAANGSGWWLRGAAAWAHGDDRTDAVPLRSIDPATASLGLAYDGGTWGVELASSAATRKRRVPVSRALPNPWQPPGYAVLDLLVHRHFAPGARVDVGVFNLGNRRYTPWASVPGVAATSPTLDRYSMPGRNVGVSLALDW